MSIQTDCARPCPQQAHIFFNRADDSRVMMRWWWFGPEVSEAEIRRQLTLMARSDIGGVEVSFIYPIAPLPPADTAEPIRFLDARFRQLLGYAAQTAKELGLRFDITLGSGWPFGGPQIDAHHSAASIRIEQVPVAAQQTRIPLSFPLEAEQLLFATANGKCLSLRQGALHLDEPPAAATSAILMLQAPTGQQVKRAALGAEGAVLDHYNDNALEIHLNKVGRPLLEAAGAGRVRAIFCDSLEVYRSNWTPDFFEQFSLRRGYDLRQHLPQLLPYMVAKHPPRDAGWQEIDNHTCANEALAAIACDYARTLTELLETRFLKPLQAFAYQHGVLSRVQAYGVPPASLSSYRYVDIPEGETTLGSSAIQLPADWTELTPNRFAASAASHSDSPIASGETWTRLHSPPYAATPLDMKAEADRFFLQGINHLMGHGWCYRPDGADPSQWVFYAAANFNESNPWFPLMPYLMRYFERVCSLLREGRAVADLALYLPDHDVRAATTFSTAKENLHHVNALRAWIGTELPEQLLAMGYTFELTDDAMLADAASTRPPRYRGILLPHVKRIPPKTLEHLQTLEAAGVQIIALDCLPDKPHEFLDYAAQKDRVRSLVATLFNGQEHSRAVHLQTTELGKLPSLVPPGATLLQRAPDIGYVHRALANGTDLYFFANTTNETKPFAPVLRKTKPYNYCIDPMAGTVCPRPHEPQELPAYASVVVVAAQTELDAGNFPGFTFIQKPAQACARMELTAEWRIECAALHFSQSISAPVHWEGIAQLRNFSGEVIYRTAFTLSEQEVAQRPALTWPEAKPRPARRRHVQERNQWFQVFLDPPVRDAAIVFVNGKEAGALFAPPYRIDISEVAIAGENQLEIRVYNRLINQLEHAKRYDFAQVHAHFGQRFDGILNAEDWIGESSGLGEKPVVMLHQ